MVSSMFVIDLNKSGVDSSRLKERGIVGGVFLNDEALVYLARPSNRERNILLYSDCELFEACLKEFRVTNEVSSADSEYPDLKVLIRFRWVKQVTTAYRADLEDELRQLRSVVGNLGLLAAESGFLLPNEKYDYVTRLQQKKILNSLDIVDDDSAIDIKRAIDGIAKYHRLNPEHVRVVVDVGSN